MAAALRFTIEFAPETVDHLAAIASKYHRLIRETVVRQLRFAPDAPTRNRKLLEPPTPFGATWELRFGPGNRFRVFYEIDPEEQHVWILAIGVKERNRSFFAGEEFDL